jgi:type II secretion system protein I
MSRIGNRKKGFTLIEVLLAISILAFGTISVLRAYGASVRILTIEEDSRDAVYLLREKMREIEMEALEEGGILPGTSSGRFDDEFKDYQWEVEISPSEDEKLNNVYVTVFNEKITPLRRFSLVSYVKNYMEAEEE